MPVDPKLLEILCCPVSKTPLAQVSASRLDRLNAAIAEGQLKFIGGDPVTEPLSDALVTIDAKVVYPVEDDIPILLEEKGIGTTQLQPF